MPRAARAVRSRRGSTQKDLDCAQVVVGTLSRGAMFPADGLVLVTEEEIFGGRAHRRKERKQKDVTRPFLEDLRTLAVGDFVVHVEHGIGATTGSCTSTSPE